MVDQRTLAQMSAAGTATPGQPAPPAMPPPPGLPGSPADPFAGQAPPPPEMPEAPPPDPFAGPPAGIEPARPVVAPHASARSVGTHGSRSPNKRANAAHGMTK